MEVGAVKQDFNTEVILLKKKLNQAKIQIIHKLTRKAKQLTEKKTPEKLQEKLKRKAESAVKEVLIIKKIKPKDLAKFIVTHKGELNTFLNKPQVDEDKACARLVLHKALQDKYKFIRGRFSNVQIQDLFMSRLERQKIKKEAKEKQKNKKKAKNEKVVNSEGDWNVEDIAMDESKVSVIGDVDEISGDEGSENEVLGDENKMLGDESEQSEEDDEDSEPGDEEQEQSKIVSVSLKVKPTVTVAKSAPKVKLSVNTSKVAETEEVNVKPILMGVESEQSEEDDEDSGPEDSDETLESTRDEEQEESKILNASLKLKPTVANAKSATKAKLSVNTSKKEETEVVNVKPIQVKEIKNKNPQKEIIKKNPVKKQKELDKTKHFNEKIIQKKLKKDLDAPLVENKIVDPFFMTSTGDNYMSVVEPRAPDEIKDEHIGGNRKLRRAVQFGLVPKSKLRQNNNYHKEDRFNRQNGYDRGNNSKGKFNDRPQNDRRNFNDRKSFNNDFNDKRGFNNRNDKNNDDQSEKLHPSWEAKKKKSGLLPFEGKKIVFDES